MRPRERALFDVVAGNVVGMADGLGNGDTLLHDEPFLPKGAIIRIVAGELVLVSCLSKLHALGPSSPRICCSHRVLRWTRVVVCLMCGAPFDACADRDGVAQG